MILDMEWYPPELARTRRLKGFESVAISPQDPLKRPTAICALTKSLSYSLDAQTIVSLNSGRKTVLACQSLEIPQRAL
jgi:hypothetical protein